MLANVFSKLFDLCPLLLEDVFSLTGQITHWSLTVAEEEFLHHVATRSTHFRMEKRRSVLSPVLTQFPHIILIIISGRLTHSVSHGSEVLTCISMSPPIERWCRNVVFLHLSAARNYVEHATCASYSWTAPSPDQWSQDWFSGVDSLFYCNRISKCLLLSRWRAFGVVVIVKTAMVFNRLTGPPNSTNCAGRMLNRSMFQELKEILMNTPSSPFFSYTCWRALSVMLIA